MASCFPEFVVYNSNVVAHLSYSEDVPNLKALADIMNAEYARDENDIIIRINSALLLPKNIIETLIDH
jgi:hypothetical protein